MMCAIEFIPSGALRREPLRHEISPEEMEMMKTAGEEEGMMNDETAAEAEEEFEDVDEDDNEIADNGDRDEYGLPASLRMDEYDEDEDEPGGIMANAMMMGFEDEEDDDEGSDAEDNFIEPTDIVMMSARTDEEISILEVHCYDPNTGNLWIHHDITLAAFPLSIAFLDMPPSTVNSNAAGAYVAVGTFKPGIEIWNLDVLDPLEPSAVLGGPDMTVESGKSKKNKKKKNREPPLLADSHTDAVMSIDWNRTHRQVLASGSADTVVKLWDVTTQQCSHTCTHHTDKVQAVAWHPTEAAVLATGSYDRKICVLDARSPNSVSTMHMPADLECLSWDPHHLERLVGCSEDGTVACFDPRNASTALWTMNAHQAGVSSLTFAPHIPGMMATASADKTVKLWDCSVGGAVQPACVGQREIGVGKLFGLTWSSSESNPWTLACAGSKGIVGIWEVDESEAVTARFSPRLSPSTRQAYESNASTAQQSQTSRSVGLAAEVQQGVQAGAGTTAGAPVNDKKKKKKKSDNKKKTQLK